MASLIERHRTRIHGVLSCFDRVVIRGTLPSVCHAQVMATTLDSRGIRLFDYATEPSRCWKRFAPTLLLFLLHRRKCSGSASSAYRRRVPFARTSTSTATTGWPLSSKLPVRHRIERAADLYLEDCYARRTAARATEFAQRSLPHVAGAAALLLQINRDLTCTQIAQLLMRAAARTGAASSAPDDTWGGGKLDIEEAIRLARTVTFPVITNVTVRDCHLVADERRDNRRRPLQHAPAQDAPRPMPPSKARGDPLYDDRMLRVLRAMDVEGQLDIRELLYLSESIDAAHTTADRPSVAQLVAKLSY